MTTVFPALTCSSLGDWVYCCYGSKPWCHKELSDLTNTSAGDYWKSAYLKKKQDFLEVYQTIIYAQIQPKAEKLTVKPHSSHHEAKQAKLGGLRKPFAWQWNKKKQNIPVPKSAKLKTVLIHPQASQQRQESMYWHPGLHHAKDFQTRMKSIDDNLRSTTWRKIIFKNDKCCHSL